MKGLLAGLVLGSLLVLAILHVAGRPEWAGKAKALALAAAEQAAGRLKADAAVPPLPKEPAANSMEQGQAQNEVKDAPAGDQEGPPQARTDQEGPVVDAMRLAHAVAHAQTVAAVAEGVREDVGTGGYNSDQRSKDEKRFDTLLSVLKIYGDGEELKP